MGRSTGNHTPAGAAAVTSWRRRAGADPRRTALVVAALAAAAAYAGWASGTTPFTDAAYLFVSVPSALLAANLVLQYWWPEQGPWRRLPAERPVRDGGSALWLAVIGLLVAVELASYFHSGPRADYPTISSGADALFDHQAAKAGGFFAWLTIGWYLAKR